MAITGPARQRCAAFCAGAKTRPGQGKVNGNNGPAQLARFQAALTGRDNIYLNGLMLGIPRRQIKAMFDDIVAFAELEKFIDIPVKYYSSGMVSRLGFSIAASMDPDIFIIDEALSAGDAAFKEKASERIQEIIADSKAVIIVSHNMRFIQNVPRAVWLKTGRLYDGSPEEAVALYRKDAQKSKVKLK